MLARPWAFDRSREKFTAEHAERAEKARMALYAKRTTSSAEVTLQLRCGDTQ
jgi:hypothetical protein